MMNQPDPVVLTGVHLEFEGKMVPIEQFHLKMPKERLIPAGMEDTYVTTFTQRGRGEDEDGCHQGGPRRCTRTVD